MSCADSRIANVFLKRRNEPTCSTQRSLSVTSLWGGKKEENSDEAAKKVTSSYVQLSSLVVTMLRHLH